MILITISLPTRSRVSAVHPWIPTVIINQAALGHADRRVQGLYRPAGEHLVQGVQIRRQLHDVHPGAPDNGQEARAVRGPLAATQVVLVVVVGPLRPGQLQGGLLEVVVGVGHVGALQHRVVHPGRTYLSGAPQRLWANRWLRKVEGKLERLFGRQLNTFDTRRPLLSAVSCYKAVV